MKTNYIPETHHYEPNRVLPEDMSASKWSQEYSDDEIHAHADDVELAKYLNLCNKFERWSSFEPAALSQRVPPHQAAPPPPPPLPLLSTPLPAQQSQVPHIMTQIHGMAYKTPPSPQLPPSAGALNDPLAGASLPASLWGRSLPQPSYQVRAGMQFPDVPQEHKPAQDSSQHASHNNNNSASERRESESVDAKPTFGMQLEHLPVPPRVQAPREDQHQRRGSDSAEDASKQCKHRNVYKIFGEDLTRNILNDAHMKQLVRSTFPDDAERDAFHVWLTSKTQLNKLNTKAVLNKAWIIDEERDDDLRKRMKTLIYRLSMMYYYGTYAEKHLEKSRKISDKNRVMYRKFIEKFQVTLNQQEQLRERWNGKEILAMKK